MSENGSSELTEKGVLAGTCRTCGRDLVQVAGDRTYHPASVLGPEEMCAALLLIPGTRLHSFDVPDDQFTRASQPDKQDQP